MAAEFYYRSEYEQDVIRLDACWSDIKFPEGAIVSIWPGNTRIPRRYRWNHPGTWTRLDNNDKESLVMVDDITPPKKQNRSRGSRGSRKKKSAQNK